MKFSTNLSSFVISTARVIDIGYKLTKERRWWRFETNNRVPPSPCFAQEIIHRGGNWNFQNVCRSTWTSTKVSQNSGSLAQQGFVSRMIRNRRKEIEIEDGNASKIENTAVSRELYKMVEMKSRLIYSLYIYYL